MILWRLRAASHPPKTLNKVLQPLIHCSQIINHLADLAAPHPACSCTLPAAAAHDFHNTGRPWQANGFCYLKGVSKNTMFLICNENPKFVRSSLQNKRVLVGLVRFRQTLSIQRVYRNPTMNIRQYRVLTGL